MPAATIPTVTLNDDNSIPVLGLGVAELSAEETESAVASALEAGYRLIDTAKGNEEAVGRAIASSGIARDEVFVSTKLATEDQGFQSSQDAIKASLERLGLEYVDLYLMDWPAEANGKYIDAWGGIMRSRQDGLIKSIGVANFTAENLSDIIDLSYFPPVINQVELHPLLNQTELRPVHAEHSIITGAYIPLGEGKLAENAAIAEVAAAHGKSPAQVLIRWSLQQGDVVVARANPAQIAENADVFDFELSAAEVETLSGLDDGTRFLPNPGA
ncbi:diketogulonate reductase-like aldo/keto reductase [Mycolicibacterium sp. BK556]|uniref:aldo/keto reductase n=1 Tax=Mycobacteriaceae TaxID=1762 RepID=UPI00105F1722|nr:MULTISPECIES: aldo/keto reductase [Mycobacteriaceae]MBB3604829.1 diketogulonate reductase-like aldo/keto reductase [Mycolicibacterium sp. BK556]MBB3634458.1 diketogulonate reductase-like aldo/keto reductase [Mycolicibacterium sp. BK607]MBB3752035.1 diketogulonate reductase-like aldo/keto reductase [Mycolicibacterium sp. BK634]TDO17717.1 diketogulonate reductase-like aldo/keto reductase [Mycobacterium sp. BK086]